MSGQEITLGRRLVTIEPFSGRKVLRSLKLLRGISKGAPEILTAWAEFTAKYEQENKVELTRAEAEVRFGPGKLDHITDEAWQSSDNRIRLPKSPSTQEKIVAVFPMAFDLAEQEITRLLALVAIPEDELKDARGDVEAKLDEIAEEILDAPFEQLVELAVLGGEAVDEQYERKAADLGGRMGNALRLVGLNPEKIRARRQTSEGSSTEKPTSSSASPTPSDGDPTRPSEPTGGSSPALTTV